MPNTNVPNPEAERQRLTEAARRYRDFTELSCDWYWEMDDQLRFSYFSREFEQHTGISLGGVLGKTRWDGLGDEAYGEVDWDGHKRTLGAREPFRGFEYPSRRLTGRVIWFRASGKPRFDDQRNFIGYFGIASDVTAFKNIEDKLRATNAAQHKLIQELEQTKHELTDALGSLEKKHLELQQLNEELHTAAITDPLTGAYNRRFFFETVLKLVSSVNRHRHALSIVMLDLDHFKEINDRIGHLAGDQVLQAAARLWKEELREEDVFARFGGEEFIIALPNTDAGVATRVAERLCAKLKLHGRAMQLWESSVDITVSCGVTQYRCKEEHIEQTIKRADEALYAAKHGGRNQVATR